MYYIIEEDTMSIFSFLSKKPTLDAMPRDLNALLDKDLMVDVLNASTTMMLIYSKKDGWVGANKKFFDFLGYQDIYDFRRQHASVRDVFLSESEEIFTEGDKSWLEYIKKHKQSGYQVRLYNDQSEIRDILLKCNRVNKKNDIYTLEFEDITTIIALESKIQEVEKLKTKFLSNIGHEFRTPMNGIIGFIDLLSQTNMDRIQDEYLRLIEHSSRSLMSNIETLLDLSQLQGGRLTIDNADFEIITEMEELVYNHMVMAQEKGIKLLSFIDPKLPEEINSDIRKIKQIMNALIHNAIKFTPRGGKIIVEVKLLKRQFSGECSIGFSVKDNGKGISKRDLHSILEPFNSGGQADERLGVGLSLSNGLIQLLGSELHIKSEENTGSYFNFVLNPPNSKGHAYKMMPKKKVRVLLLDKKKIDDANFLCVYLRSFGIDIVKSNTLDSTIYDDIDALYIVADQSDSSWMFKLGTLGRKVPVIMMMQEGEKLQTKLTHVVDEVIKCPLFPSRVSKHLKYLHSIELRAVKKEKLVIKDEVKALVVEDNLINQRLMQIMLQGYNISVIIAANGNEAVSLCKENTFDIIFMDIDMPEKNGIVATSEIKQRANSNSRTPIIAFTAMAMQGDREMLLNQGLDDYISKPIEKEKLENILNKYLKALLV